MECGGSFTLSFEGPPLLRLRQHRCVDVWAERLSVSKAGTTSRTPKGAAVHEGERGILGGEKWCGREELNLHGLSATRS